jgi:nitroreductase
MNRITSSYKDALQVLHQRVSVSRVSDPAPDQATREAIFRAALRAADHGLLRPWRFLIIEGESRHRLGELWGKASQADNPEMTENDIQSARKKVLRAPMIVVGIVSPKAHPKVPESEQHLAAGAAMQNMLNAAYALDVGAIWRTGPMATHPVMREGLGLEAHESIIGFLYLGSIDGPMRSVREEALTDFFQEW